MLREDPGRSFSDQNELWHAFGEDESATLEFKEQTTRANRLQEPLVAFANVRGGLIVVGVTNSRPRRVVGIRSVQDDEERVQEAARSTQPPLSVRVTSAAVGAQQVLLVEVDPLDRGWVHTSDGRVLVRAGPTNRALVGTELARFIRERGIDPVEDETVSGVGLEDLNGELVRRYLRSRLGRSRVQVAAGLRDLGLVTADRRLRLATYLLFGRQPQDQKRRFGIVLSRFAGRSGGGAQLRGRSELTGPLPALIENADRQIYEEMRRDAVVRGLLREEVPEFPPVVLREALVNAVAHRDYSLRGSAVEVRLFDDAIEIESPGTLPGYVTIENLRTSQYSRNERIMDGLQRLGLVEEAGQGIDRMIAEMEDALLDPPEFEEGERSFTVRLRGGSRFAAEDRLWAARFRPLGLSPAERIALVFARRNGAITNEDLRNLRHLDRDESRVVLQDLTLRGLLVALGRGRGSRYVLSDLAAGKSTESSVKERAAAVLRFARRNGKVVNSDVRGLLGVDRASALEILEDLVAKGVLVPVGERRGRRYLPTDRAIQNDPGE